MRKSSPEFARIDERADTEFYAEARLVEHIDAHALAAVEAIYRDRIAPDSDVLDLMSSWVSHLPPEITYRSVTGLGMNAAELRANPRLDRRVVHDLNANPTLSFAENSFDAALICVSIQYLTSPVAVMRDLARVVRPGGVLIVSFSNRCFPTKAVAIWQATDDRGHLSLVSGYLTEAGGWSHIEMLAAAGRGDPLYAVVALRAPGHQARSSPLPGSGTEAPVSSVTSSHDRIASSSFASAPVSVRACVAHPGNSRTRATQ